MWFASIIFILVTVLFQSGRGNLVEASSEGNETDINGAPDLNGMIQLFLVRVRDTNRDEGQTENSSFSSCIKCSIPDEEPNVDKFNLTGTFKISLKQPKNIKLRSAYLDTIDLGKTENMNTPENSSSYLKGNSSLQLIKLGDSYYHFANTKANFYKAFQFCRKHNMDLLSIESKEENDLIMEHLKKYHPLMVHVWTSGTDLHQEGQFIWLATGESVSFSSWGLGAPDNFLFSEHCLQILKVGLGTYVWNDVVCKLPLDIVCEVRTCSKLCQMGEMGTSIVP